MESNPSGTFFPFLPATRMYTMSLAQRVRDYRYSKGWGPDELANRAAISRTALYQIESGKTELPRAGTLRRIALALEVPMDSLLGHGEAARPQQSSASAAVRRTLPGGEWIPAEGGPLTVGSSRSPAVEAADAARFGVEAQPTPEPLPPARERERERELAWKLHELLGSPLGEGIARIVEESHRLLPQIRA
jgi:transcriptional regulator with XRE-family HTH domain